MQFSSAFLAAMALAMANAVSFTNSAFNGITAGQPITLTWTDASGPVTILLKNGASTDLKTVSTVASGQTSGSYTWNVPATLPADTYALEITDSTATPNYSPQFQLIGGASASASASSVVSSAVSSVSSVLSSQSSVASSSISSVVSSVSSLVKSITGNTTTSASASSSTISSNATVTNSSSILSSTTTGSLSTKASSTASKTSSSAAGSSTVTVPNANSAVQIASPLALVFLTFAAIFSLN